MNLKDIDKLTVKERKLVTRVFMDIFEQLGSTYTKKEKEAWLSLAFDEGAVEKGYKEALEEIHKAFAKSAKFDLLQKLILNINHDYQQT